MDLYTQYGTLLGKGLQPDVNSDCEILYVPPVPFMANISEKFREILIVGFRNFFDFLLDE